MHKLTPIFLTILILTAGLPIERGIRAIQQLNSLLSHFIHHAFHDHESINLIDFVHMHYAGHEHYEADPDGHENLPFQHQPEQQNIAAQTPGLIPVFYFLPALNKQSSFSGVPIARPELWLSFAFSGDIWQPPKA